MPKRSPPASAVIAASNQRQGYDEQEVQTGKRYVALKQKDEGIETDGRKSSETSANPPMTNCRPAGLTSRRPSGAVSAANDPITNEPTTLTKPVAHRARWSIEACRPSRHRSACSPRPSSGFQRRRGLERALRAIALCGHGAHHRRDHARCGLRRDGSNDRSRQATG